MPHTLIELYSELKIDPEHPSGAHVDKLEQWIKENVSLDLVIASHEPAVKFANYDRALSVFFENKSFSTLDKSFLKTIVFHGYNKVLDTMNAEQLQNVPDLIRLAVVRGHLHTLQSILSKTNYTPEKTSQILHSTLKLPVSHDEQLKNNKEAIFDVIMARWPKLFLARTPENSNILHSMAENNFHSVIGKYLSKHPKLALEMNNLGQYPITCAILNDANQVATLLLKVPKVTTLKDPKGRLPLHHACFYGNETTVSLCLSADSTVLNSKDKIGQTPLILACIADKEDTLRTLLQAGAIVNIKDNLGRTALHYAVINENSKAIELLLKTGNIDLNTLDNNGMTPLDYAVSATVKDSLAAQGATNTGKTPDSSMRQFNFQ